MIETLINNMSGLSGPALKMCAEFLHKVRIRRKISLTLLVDSK